MKSDQAIIVQGLKKSFKDLEVLKGVNLSVERGTMLALLGPNGAGKTTIVRILSTLLKPDGGSARINGWDVESEADKVRSVIGLTGQYAAVDEYLTASENLQMMGRLYHLSQADTARRSHELLEQFDLTEAADRIAKTYSGGMRRRLDLALSLIATPPIIFLDEPTTGLDPRSRQGMWQVIRDLMAGGTTILLTTQYLEEADQLADQIAVIDNGTIVANGTANELKKDVGNDRIEFIIARQSDFTKAAAAVASAEAHIDKKQRSINITSNGGARELHDLLGRLQQAGVEVESVSLHKPTLDDVFLKLTGKPVIEAEKESV